MIRIVLRQPERENRCRFCRNDALCEHDPPAAGLNRRSSLAAANPPLSENPFYSFSMAASESCPVIGWREINEDFRRPKERQTGVSNVRSWDPAVGQDGESMITQGWGKSVAVSHPFQLGVAKTIHISEKTVTSALGPGRLKTRRFLVHQGRRNTEARYMAFICAPPLHNGPLQTRNSATTPPISANRCFYTLAWVGNGRSCPDTRGSANQATLIGGV